LTVTPERKGREESGDVGMFPVIRTLVQDVKANSPAARAGVKPGDEIIRVNGIDLRTSGRTLQQTIQQIPDKSFPITVLRSANVLQTAPAPQASSRGFLSSVWNGVLRLVGKSEPAADVVNPAPAFADSKAVADGRFKEVELNVAPELQDGRKMIGIGIQFPSVHVKLGAVEAFKKSIQSNKENAVLIFQVIGRLLKREASLKQLDGPVGIVAFSGQAYQAGFATLLTFMALISLNLGVLNILPIPILDGGVILLLVIESLMGRDLSLRMKERIVQASFVFLLMLTVIVLYNDVVKLLPPTQPAP
jgi:regulator of sigma E protease